MTETSCGHKGEDNKQQRRKNQRTVTVEERKSVSSDIMRDKC